MGSKVSERFFSYRYDYVICCPATFSFMLPLAGNKMLILNMIFKFKS